MKKNRTCIFLLISLLTGCQGYQWGYYNEHYCCESISIPFIAGDVDGNFTEKLIYQISRSGIFRYEPEGGQYQLTVKLGGLQMEQIGYRRDVNADGTFKKNVLPTESREKIEVEVTLIDNTTQKTIWGPYIISTAVDFDYLTQHSVNDLSFIDSTGNRVPVLWFSMGQLEPISSAQEGAKDRLYQVLARKIVDALRAR